MTTKALFCAFLWLTISVLSRIKIKVRPKGLRNFAFNIFIFDFLSPFSLLPYHFSLTPRPSSLTPDPSPLAPNVIIRKHLRVDKLLYICRETSTNVMSARQIHLFMQNKAKFRKSQDNVTALLTREYVQMDTWSIRKNKPKTKPIQTQNKPNSKPIQSQYKPNLSCRSLWRSRNKPNL